MAFFILCLMSPLPFSMFAVRRMSVSTEYPMRVSRAARTGSDSLMPRKLITAMVAIISVIAARMTIEDGTGDLNIMKTASDIKTNATMSAICACWKKSSPIAGPTVL